MENVKKAKVSRTVAHYFRCKSLVYVTKAQKQGKFIFSKLWMNQSVVLRDCLQEILLKRKKMFF
ncbi:hypothetical protein SAMN02982927_00503 [Sporolactobacillus nakayamae]|uniref:Uncharacterized protein n=1 Tax=Sporolactobacillus nakayamae TaxID=269670 RepID=A0A1I2NT48_9BACL|nr:hypothetical protein SAMN02982927_00503 [Sporolactobacillus nakayamae]